MPDGPGPAAASPPDGALLEVVAAVPDGILVVGLDGNVRFANPAASRLLGRRPEEMADLPLGLPLVRGDVAELDVVRPDGSAVVVEMQVAAISWQGENARLVTLRDLTDRVVAERLARSEQRYALSALGANDGMWDWSRGNGRVFTSGRLRELLGWPAIDSSEQAEWWLEQMRPEDRGPFLRAIREHVEGRSARLDHECRMRCRDGSWLWVRVRGVVVQDGGEPVRAAGSVTDITDGKRAEEDLRRMALHDALTGLANRALFLDRLGRAIDRTKREGRQFALVLFDLDHFKVVNDTLGHGAGDALLVELGARIQSCVRTTDTVARLGGDEFAVLLDHPEGLGTVLATVTRIQTEMTTPFVVNSEMVRTTASIGVVLSQDLPAEPDVALRTADIAMYRAKALGRNAVQVFEPTMHTEIERRRRRQEELLEAERRGDLFLRYQPVVRLEDAHIVGFEALLRLRAEHGRVVDANEFLQTAEDAGVMLRVGWDVLVAACRQAHEWRVAGYDVPVSVNVSEQQLAHGDVAERVADALGRAGVDGGALRLEVSERSLPALTRSEAGELDRCRALGVDILVDDLATGPTPLASLDRPAVAGVKIDRTFVRRLDDPKSRRFVRALAGFARDLGLDVIAEGVETPEQRKWLLALGCAKGQGYLFAPALDAGAATLALEEQDRSEGPGAGRAG